MWFFVCLSLHLNFFGRRSNSLVFLVYCWSDCFSLISIVGRGETSKLIQSNVKQYIGWNRPSWPSRGYINCFCFRSFPPYNCFSFFFVVFTTVETYMVTTLGQVVGVVMVCSVIFKKWFLPMDKGVYTLGYRRIPELECWTRLFILRAGEYHGIESKPYCPVTFNNDTN